jgi:4a-hydroxytetrahydrobiopterin dehydratase
VDPEGWTEVDGALERTFELDSFAAALDFVNRLGALAESEDHHPDIAISYRRVTVR